METNNLIRKLSSMIEECDNIVFFGGAGVSTESGVKDYRSEDGLYNTIKDYGVSPERILSRSFFHENPDVFYDFFKNYFITDAKPNAAHKVLAELEKRGKIRSVITQNIDNLHQVAGSKNVVELHGNTNHFFCSECGKNEECGSVLEQIMSDVVPRCRHCGGVMKPNVVLYEEMLHDGVMEKAIHDIENADMLIVGGTSLVVNPAALFVMYFSGKYFVIINKTETPYDSKADLIIRDKIGVVLEQALNGIN